MKQLRILEVMVAICGLVLLPVLVSAQDNVIVNNQYKVVSFNGLNMRQNPHPESLILSALPFGTQVELLESEGFGLLALPSRTLYYANLPSAVEFKGSWWKVKYQENVGFVYSGFLAPTVNWNKGANFEDINTDYHLLLPGFGCFSNIPCDNRFTWKGLYHTGENQYEFRVVDPRIFYNYEDIGSQSITVADNRGLILIIGSRERVDQLTPGALLHETYPKAIENTRMPNPFPPSIQQERTKTAVEPWRTRLFIQEGERRQFLNPHGSHMDTARRVLWNGDLDGDKQDDYVVQYGEKWSHTILYLSTAAEGDQIVRPVAVFYSGYCC